MTAIRVSLDGDGCWPDLAERPYVGATIEAAALLRNGTAGGKPTVTLRIETRDGQVVLAETTLALFLTVADAFRAAMERRS